MPRQAQIRFAILVVSVLLLLPSCRVAQDSGLPKKETIAPIEGMKPNEVVDELWRLATQGQLLTEEGWQRAGKLYKDPTAFKRPQKILVVSNDWGPAYEIKLTPDQKDVQVAVGCTTLGNIDSLLRYTPVPQGDYIKEAYLYHLLAVPEYWSTYGSDGKLLSKNSTGKREWKIQESQGSSAFTTVNTAIRYVLEQRDKMHDPALKQNADRTLEILKRLH